MAAQAGQVHMLQYLMEELQCSVDNSINSKKTTPLHCAVRAGQIKSVEFLLAMGAEPKLMDSWDRSCEYSENYIGKCKYIMQSTMLIAADISFQAMI